MLNVTSEVASMTTEPAQLGPLSAMVKEMLDTPGMSIRILSARTYDDQTGEEVLNKDFWFSMARGTRAKVSAEQLEWMARAMRKPEAVIKEAAAAQYFGYRPVHLSGYGDSMRRIIVRAGALPPSEQDRIAAWLEMIPDEKSSN